MGSNIQRIASLVNFSHVTCKKPSLTGVNNYQDQDSLPIISL
jgi:hypothetical protein